MSGGWEQHIICDNQNITYKWNHQWPACQGNFCIMCTGFICSFCWDFFVLFCSPLSAARHSCAISQYHWQHWKWLKLYDWYQNNHTKWLQPIMHLWYSVKCDFSGDSNFRLSSDNVPVMNLVIFQNVAKLTRSATGRGVTTNHLGILTVLLSASDLQVRVWRRY